MGTVSEGGAQGIALLAVHLKNRESGEILEVYLQSRVIAGIGCETLASEAGDVAGFAAYMEHYIVGLAIERAATEVL